MMAMVCVLVGMILAAVIVFGAILLADHLKKQRVIDWQIYIEEIAIPKFYDEMVGRTKVIIEETMDSTMKMMKKMTETEL